MTNFEQLQTNIVFQKALMDNNAVALFFSFKDRVIRYANKRACELFGYDYTEMVGHSFELIHINRHAFEQFLKEYTTLEVENISNIEYPFRKKDGSLVYCSVYGSALDSANLENGVIWSLLDITNEKKARRDLKLANYAIQKSSDVIYWTHLDSKIVKANESACLMLRYSSEELSILSVMDINPNLSKNSWNDMVETLQRDGNIKFESIHKTKNGDIIPVGITADYINIEGEEFVFSIVRDLSEQRQLQQAMEQAKKGAESANLAKSQFLANMSHEIRTPMNAILGLTDLVMDTNLNSTQRDYLQKISSASRSLLHILNDILDYSKIEAGKLDITEGEFVIDSMFAHLSNLFTPMADSKNIKLRFTILDGMPEKIVSDELRIGQILSNLIGNAIKFTEKGSVVVSAEFVSKGDVVEVVKFSVQDTGIGLDKEQLDRLFQPFTQVDGSITRKYGGTGLGLSISQELVELMGGSVSVVSELGVGSIFSFTISAGLYGSLDSKDSREFDKNEILLNARPLKGCKILLAEDNELNQEVAKGLLTKLGLIVDIAHDGKEAVEKIKEKKYDCILMDMQMPVMNGIEATRYIRQKLQNRELPIVAMTAAAMETDRNECITAGMDDYLPKPIDIEKLVTILLSHVAKINSDNLKTSSNTQMEGAQKKIVDIDVVMRRFLLSRDEVVDLLKNYANANRNFTSQLEKILESNDLKTASEFVHKLKGASANLCIIPVYESSIVLETQIKNREALSSIENFESTLKSAIEHIDQIVATEAAIKEETICISDTQMLNALGRLQRKLKDRSFIDFQEKEDIFEMLEKSTLPSDMLQNIKNSVGRFDYESALSSIDKIFENQKEC